MRAPAAFMEALLAGPELKHIRAEMRMHNCSYVVEGTGAKIFVWPGLYQKVMQELEKLSIQLRPSHVIAAESLLPCLEASIASIPSQKNVRVKKDGIFTLACVPKVCQTRGDGHAAEPVDRSALVQEIDTNIQIIEDWKHVLGVGRTFICSVRLLRDSESVTQSTTEAHGGVNPRRVAT